MILQNQMRSVFSFLSSLDSLSFSADEITSNENERSLIYNHRIQVKQFEIIISYLLFCKNECILLFLNCVH